MYAPPALHSGHLDDLIVLVGGDKMACRLLDITPRTLRRWRAADYPVPQMALKLLWYASPWGQQAAEVDLFNEVQVLRLLANAEDRRAKLPVEADRFLDTLKTFASRNPIQHTPVSPAAGTPRCASDPGCEAGDRQVAAADAPFRAPPT